MEKKKYWFFGSKLNSILLLVLIILMVFAIRIMLQNKSTYLPFLATEKVNAPVQDEEWNMRNKNLIEGRRDDLVSFSIAPNSQVHGVVSYNGIVKGGYFFEANILINILDSNKKVLINSHALSIADWMTEGPVDFKGNIDFTGLPKSNAYFEIHNDNASGLPANDKSILIPIIIE